jgi:hypothetical protein
VSFAPSNAAQSLLSAIAASLASAGFPALQNGTAPSTSALAQLDGWISQIVTPQATVIVPSAQTVPPGGIWTTIASWSVTPLCPRDHLVLATLTGMVDTVTSSIGYRVRYDGNVLASASLVFRTANATHTFPSLFAVLPASRIPFPLAAKTLDVQVQTPATACSFYVTTGDTVNLAIR